MFLCFNFWTLLPFFFLYTTRNNTEVDLPHGSRRKTDFTIWYHLSHAPSSGTASLLPWSPICWHTDKGVELQRVWHIRYVFSFLNCELLILAMFCLESYLASMSKRNWKDQFDNTTDDESGVGKRLKKALVRSCSGNPET